MDGRETVVLGDNSILSPRASNAMPLTITLSQQTQELIANSAAERGLTEKEYVEELITERVTPSRPGQRKPTGYGKYAHPDVSVDSYLAHEEEERKLDGIE